jgi:RNA polymerase sigma-70 factor (ECF subfamily)
MNDDELIQLYVRGDRSAFGRLMERHAGLVYSAAMRQLGNAHEAEDLTQAVFFALSRKAGSLEGRMVSAWLMRAVRLGALHQLRTRRRRMYHERKAAGMQAGFYMEAAAKDYERIGPMLDAAIAGLPKADREAVLLKYHERRSVADIAAATGSTPDAVRKRLERAVGKLRRRFADQETRLTAGAVAGGLYYHLGHSAPAHVSARLQTVWASASFAPTAAAAPLADGLSHSLYVDAAKGFLIKGALAALMTLLVLALCAGGWRLTQAVSSPSPAIKTGR